VFSFSDSFSRVHIEAKNWNHNDFVENQGAARKNDETDQ
jgi:hypothetical protein